MTKNNWRIFFEDYYFQRLDDEIKAEFESALQKDIALQREYHDFLSIVKAVELNRIKDEILEKKEVREYIERSFRQKKQSGRWWGIIIGVLFILIIAIYYFSIESEYNSDGGLDDPWSETEEIQSPPNIPQDRDIEITPDNIELRENNKLETEQQEKKVDRIAMVTSFLEETYFSEIITRGMTGEEKLSVENIQNCIELIKSANFESALGCLERSDLEIYPNEKLWLQALVYFGLGYDERAIENLEMLRRDRLSRFLPHANQLLNLIKSL